jgi:hypothetical protein
MARFEQTSCSQCGREFGPGAHGFSHCADHGGTSRCDDDPTPMKYSHCFSFKGGYLEVKTIGYGDKDGSGVFVFTEEEANWEAREERSGCDIVLTCAKSEMIELRDFLNCMYPATPSI